MLQLLHQLGSWLSPGAVQGGPGLVKTLTCCRISYCNRGMLGSDSLPAKLTGKAASTASKQGPAGGLLLLPPGEAVDVSIRFRPGSLSQEVGPGTRMQSAASGSLSSNCGARCSTYAGPPQSAPGHDTDEPYTGQYKGALVVAYTTGQQQVCCPCNGEQVAVFGMYWNTFSWGAEQMHRVKQTSSAQKSLLAVSGCAGGGAACGFAAATSLGGTRVQGAGVWRHTCSSTAHVGACNHKPNRSRCRMDSNNAGSCSFCRAAAWTG